MPLSRLFSEKVGADRFRALGFETDLLDISPQYYNSENLKSYYSGESTYHIIDPTPIQVNSREKMCSIIENFKQGDIIWHLGRFFKSVEDDYIFDYLNKKNIPYYLQHFDVAIPPAHYFRRAHMKMHLYKQKYLNRYIKPRGIVGSGRVGRLQSKIIYPESQFLSIPSVKILWTSSNPVIQGEYILFVDENVEYAPDAKLFGYSVTNDINGYYDRMNQLFSMFEMWLGIPVVVAASGKYKYPCDRFQGRKIIYGKTLTLIKFTSFVIGHMSLALEQCLVSKVPFLIVDDKSFTTKKRMGFYISLLNRMQEPTLNTNVTIKLLAKYAKPDIKKMSLLVKDYLKEDGVISSYHEVVANEFKKSLVNLSGIK
jgi:hypothetical protein